MEFAAYLMTATEVVGELETTANNVGGVVIAETDCSYAIIICDADGAPADIEMTNSGEVMKVEYGGSGPIIIFPNTKS